MQDREILRMQVTTGEEGFWPQGSIWAPFNPWGSDVPRNWSYGTGQDFSAQHAIDSIDFAVMHLWPDNWAVLYGLCFFCSSMLTNESAYHGHKVLQDARHILLLRIALGNTGKSGKSCTLSAASTVARYI